MLPDRLQPATVTAYDSQYHDRYLFPRGRYSLPTGTPLQAFPGSFSHGSSSPARFCLWGP